ncbi:MAG: FG-GAP repeat protein [Cytophagaceae bacterium]|nr:FG-GAP repeat protein [Gemmatimonadaceae bacterium]
MRALSMMRPGAILLFLLPAFLGAQGPPALPPEVTRAQASLQAGQVDSAIATLEAFFTRVPNAVLGRLLLGNAYRQKGELEKAITAYDAVTQPRPQRLQAMFNAAGVRTRLGKTSEALQQLRDLKATGAFDMNLVASTADFAALRTDPRYAEVLYHASDFTRPFVEPVRIIHEWIGEAAGDQFSWVARGIGDVDGDMVIDIVTSAPTFGANGAATGPGKVYVYSGKTGRLLWQQVGAAGQVLGLTIEGTGDVNGDGSGDVIAAAPGTSQAIVYSGRDGTVLRVLDAPAPNETFGRAASGAGDQDGDGLGDLLVGAPAADSGAGKAYVFSGKTGAIIRTLKGERNGDAFGSVLAGKKGGRGTLFVVGASGGGPNRRGRVYAFASNPATPPRIIDADSTGAALGAMFVSVVGDVDGDKVLDVFASDFANSAGGAGTGRIYVHSGKDGRRLLQLTGERPGDNFGIGSADVGDINGDGHDDLVLGAWQHASAAQSGGKVYVYSGKDGTLLRSITGRVPGETFGFDATGVGDVDGDGTIDLLLTSSWSNIKGFRSGRMFVISGK